MTTETAQRSLLEALATVRNTPGPRPTELEVTA